jgi:hypothetical protein
VLQLLCEHGPLALFWVTIRRVSSLDILPGQTLTSANIGLKLIDGVGILFRWGEVEEWVVLISMSIPPVWPLFRPFTHRFINSHGQSRSAPPYKGYNQYPSSRGDLTSAVAGPIITTTISISSTKGPSAEAEPVRAASSAGSFSRYDEEEPETPHTVLSSTSGPEGWMEMSHYKNHPQ